MKDNMDTITLLLLGALATARLTRLITTDRITQAPRNALLRRLDGDGLLAYLVVCDWCVSVYTGAAVAAVAAWGPHWSAWILAALAFSYAAGWLAAREGVE
jgi:hypothetical protein